MPRPQSRAGETMEITSADVGTVSKELATANAPMNLDEMLAVIRGVDEFTAIDEDSIQADIMERMLTASSWEELTKPQEVLHAKNLLGRKLTFLGARIAKSTVENGSGVYMLIDALDGDDRILFSCGSSNVMTILAIALHREWLPADGIILQSEKATKSGYKPLNLVWAPPEDEPF